MLRDPAALKRVFGSAPAERVKLENPSFEKVFDVYGTDQIEARYLMTPAFMERVSRLAESTGGATPQLAFDGSHLLIALPLDKDRFEAQSLFTPMDDRSRTEALVEELQIVSSIIETLKLNLKTHA